MKNEKAIKFSTPMVRAVLDGGKTQTRRPIKFDKLSKIKKGRLFYSTTFDSWAIEDKGDNPEANITLVECPWGKVGDRLEVDSESITLEITDIRVEKVQEITEDGAKSEGVLDPAGEWRFELDGNPDWNKCPQCGGSGLYTSFNPSSLGAIPDTDCFECDTYKKSFSFLWDSIYEAKGFGWDTNCYVWVISFKVLTDKER